jgi:hypothetical protein
MILVSINAGNSLRVSDGNLVNPVILPSPPTLPSPWHTNTTTNPVTGVVVLTATTGPASQYLVLRLMGGSSVPGLVQLSAGLPRMGSRLLASARALFCCGLFRTGFFLEFSASCCLFLRKE